MIKAERQQLEHPNRGQAAEVEISKHVYFSRVNLPAEEIKSHDINIMIERFLIVWNVKILCQDKSTCSDLWDLVIPPLSGIEKGRVPQTSNGAAWLFHFLNQILGWASARKEKKGHESWNSSKSQLYKG